MASAEENAAGVDIRLHPTVVMSIADTHTRSLLQFNKTKSIGALFGTQRGREVRIYDTVEISYTMDAKTGLTWGQENFDSDRKLFNEVFPNYECLGWYATAPGGKIDALFDANFHSQMTKYNERPLFLLMNSTPEDEARDLPIVIYEEDIHVVGDQTRKEFVKVPFKIESDEAERVTATHCAKVVTDENKDQSVVASHYATYIKAIQALHGRLKVLHKFVSDIKEGKIKADQRILRDLKGLCNRLPTMDTSDFKQDFLVEYNDAILVAYLATLTKGEAQINEVMDKFNLTHARQGRGGGMMMPGLGGFGPVGPGLLGFF